MSDAEQELDEERKQHLAKGELFVEARQDYKRLHFAVQELRRLAVRGDPVGHVSPLFSTDGIDPGAGLGDLYRRFDEIWEHAKKLADAKIRESEDAEDVP